MDSIDDLTCKLGSLNSEQPTNDTLSPFQSQSIDLINDLKKSITLQSKQEFALRDQIYQTYDKMKRMGEKENFCYQMTSFIFLSDYQDDSSTKLENVKQIIQECTHLSMKTYFIVINNNKQQPNIKELRSLVSQFPCSLSLVDADITEVQQQINYILNELMIGQIVTKFFIHVSTNKAMRNHLEKLIQILQQVEKQLGQNDKVFWSSQRCSQQFTAVEIQEDLVQKQKLENKRKFTIYTFSILVMLSVCCYLLYVIIMTFI